MHRCWSLVMVTECARTQAANTTAKSQNSDFGLCVHFNFPFAHDDTIILSSFPVFIQRELGLGITLSTLMV